MQNRRDIDFIHHQVDPATGKTLKQVNQERRHKIALGTLAEVKFDAWFGGGACWKVHARLWVVDHSRDCDGTPLYVLSRWRDPADARRFGDLHGGMSEEALTVVELTPEVRDGYDALEWAAGAPEHPAQQDGT